MGAIYLLITVSYGLNLITQTSPLPALVPKTRAFAVWCPGLAMVMGIVVFAKLSMAGTKLNRLMMAHRTGVPEKLHSR